MNFFNSKINNIGTQKGFTILEALVGIAILIIAITATFTSVQTGLSSSIDSRDQIVASFLAQEAIEFIRNKRDTNVLSGGNSNWLAGIAANSSDACYFGSACIVDGARSTTNPPSRCPNAPGTYPNCPNLRQDTNSSSAYYGMYGNDSSWTQTNFNREVVIQNVSNGQEISVTVTMRWTKGALLKTFKIQESIFNWQ